MDQYNPAIDILRILSILSTPSWPSARPPPLARRPFAGWRSSPTCAPSRRPSASSSRAATSAPRPCATPAPSSRSRPGRPSSTSVPPGFSTPSPPPASPSAPPTSSRPPPRPASLRPSSIAPARRSALASFASGPACTIPPAAGRSPHLTPHPHSTRKTVTEWQSTHAPLGHHKECESCSLWYVAREARREYGHGSRQRGRCHGSAASLR
jgi:hypothetical protein